MKGIDYQIREPNLKNYNPVEGLIREVGQKRYRAMLKKRAPRQIWEYGVSWV